MATPSEPINLGTSADLEPELIRLLITRKRDPLATAYKELSQTSLYTRDLFDLFLADSYVSHGESLGKKIRANRVFLSTASGSEQYNGWYTPISNTPNGGNTTIGTLFQDLNGKEIRTGPLQEDFKALTTSAEKIEDEYNIYDEPRLFSDTALLNEDLAAAYYFMLWLREQKDKTKEFQKNAKEDELSTEDYNKALLKQIRENQIQRKLGDLRESIDVSGLFKRARQSLAASKFDKQQYLIQQIEDFSDLSKQRFPYQADSSKPWEPNPSQIIGVSQNRILRFTNTQKNAIGKISGTALGKELFRMSTENLSKLVPKIKIFKIKYDKNMIKTGEIELKFPTNSQVMSSPENMFDIDPNFASKINPQANPFSFSSTKRDFGIQGLTWQFDGADPFSVDRDIGATLELYFQDFSQFTAKRGAGEKKYRYIDLIVPLDTDYTGQKAKMGEHFQQDIRIEAGWEIPNSFSEEQKKAIKASQVNFILTPMDYNISFAGNGNGASHITINYRARIESMGKSRLINVIAATKEEIKAIDAFEQQINIEPPDSERVKELRKKQERLYELLRSNSSKRFIDRMINKGSVYWRKVDLRTVLISTLGKIEAQGIYNTLYDNTWDSSQPAYEDGLKDSLYIIEKSSQTADTADSETTDYTILKNLPLVTDIGEINAAGESSSIKGPEIVIYTFFGDIIQNAMDIALESGNFLGAPLESIENMKIALLEFRVGGTNYNIGDIPIDMALLTEYMQNNMGAKNEHTKSLISFISGLLAEVITNKIDTYFNLKDGTTRNFKLGYSQLNKDLRPAFQAEYNLDSPKKIALIKKQKLADSLLIYSDSPLASDFEITNYTKDKKEDEAGGLYHFALGTTKSLVKSISFDRTDLEYARERKLTINREDPYALLTNVFNVNISMFGNNYFKPGSYIYVDPKVMGDMGNPYTKGDIANTMGLGGYHIVTKVQHSISSNSYSTTIDAVWETSGDGGFSLTKSNADKETDAKKKAAEKKKESESA